MNNKDINELYKATMDNVTMPQDDKDDLRAKLAEQAQTGRSGHRLARVGQICRHRRCRVRSSSVHPGDKDNRLSSHRLHKADIPPGKWHRGDIRGKQRGKLHTVHNIYR